MPKLQCELKISKVLLSMETPRPQISIVGRVQTLVATNEEPEYHCRVDLDAKDPHVEALLTMVQELFESKAEEDSRALESAAAKRTASTSAGDLEEEQDED